MKRYYIDIYRNESILATAEIFQDTVFSATINAEDKVTATLKTLAPINLMRKDYILVGSLRYSVTKWVDLSIDHEYTYSAVFHNTNFNLFAKPFISSTGLSTFTILGTVTEHLNAVLTRINSIDSGWTAGTVFDDGRIIEIQYITDDCRSALGRIFNEFGLEVYYVLKQINLVKKFQTADDPIELSYGPGNGLYKLTEKIDGEFFTRVNGFGSTRNIPASYRGGKERLTFDPGYVDIADAESYGTPVEIEVFFEDVFPTRTGTITSVTDILKLGDSTIDFNLADNFITGETPSIVMESGHWKGQQFDIVITSYDHATKTFKIKTNSEGGISFPNAILPIQAGDTYKFIGINLPQPYIDVAEAQVQALTAEHASVAPVLEATYTLELNPIDLLNNGLVGQLFLGRKVHLTHVPAGINVNMRITSVSYPLIAPELAVAQISDKVKYSEVQQIQRIIIESAKQITVLKDNVKKLKAFTNVRLDETLGMIFDPSGEYFDPINIRPQSIETLFLSTGARSQTFSLGVTFDANAVSQFSWTAGKLTHFTVVPGTPYTWNIVSGSVTGLDNATAYYIYAKCNRANDNGVIVLDTAKRLIDSDSTYYYFLVGTISSVITDRQGNNVRSVEKSYGNAKINGAFVTAGALISQDGNTILDLDNGTFKGRLQFLSADESEYIPLTVLNAKAEASKVKTDLIKNWALQDDIIAAMQYGDTFIEGGYVKTVFLDVDTIVANGIYASTIEALDVNFVRGTIGGNEISEDSIIGAKFSIIDGAFSGTDVNISGTINATAGEIGGITIALNGLIGENFSIVDGLFSGEGLNLTGTFQAGTLSAGVLMSALGMAIYNGAYGGVSFRNDGQNIINGSYLEINVTNIIVGGSYGFTGSRGGYSYKNGLMTT